MVWYYYHFLPTRMVYGVSIPRDILHILNSQVQAAINRFIAETNDKPKPFVWTKSADAILAAVQRGRQALEAIH